MDIYLIDGSAFVLIHHGFRSIFLCIGTRAEVEEASGEQFRRMIREALAINEFKNIESATHQTVN